MDRILPPLAGRHTFLRAFASLLLLELAAISGEWLVHQVEYLIVYGGRFQQVMGASPHRFFIAPLGSALALVGLVLLSVCALVLGARHRRYVDLRRAIPLRYRSALVYRSLPISPSSVVWTAAILALCQISIYLVQENLELAVQGHSLPGVYVLVAPQYLTVIPLHLLVALCASIVLWTLSSLCFRSRTELETAERLACLLAGPQSLRFRLWVAQSHLPHRRLLRVARGLRSPPAAA